MKSIMYMFNAFKVSTKVMYDHIKYHFEKKIFYTHFFYTYVPTKNSWFEENHPIKLRTFQKYTPQR